MVRLRVIAMPFLLGIAVCAQPIQAASPPPPWQTIPLTQSAYDDETQDLGVPPGSSTIRTSNFEAPTPTKIVGAETITTPQMRDLLKASPAPVAIDVLDGNRTITMPGALWWPWAGFGSSLKDDTETRFAAALAKATGGNKATAVVFFCRSKTCWLSTNAVIRAVSLGYKNVYWYRGGLEAWRGAGLTMVPITASDT